MYFGPTRQGIQTSVGRDAVQPVAERCPFLELVAGTPGAQKGLLGQVFCFEERAEHAVAVELQLAPKGLGALLKYFARDRPGGQGRDWRPSPESEYALDRLVGSHVASSTKASPVEAGVTGLPICRTNSASEMPARAA